MNEFYYNDNTQIRIGDQIVYVFYGFPHKGEVIGFTKKMVRIRNHHGYERLVCQRRIIKI